MADISSKICAVCKLIKPINHFGILGKRGKVCRGCHKVDRLKRGLCGLCYSPVVIGKKHCQRCLDRQKESARLRNIKDKLAAIKHYGGKCKCCGESRYIFLTLDHINNDGAAHRKFLRLKGTGSHNPYVWLRQNGYPDTFQVLCFKCNCAKGKLGFCPHERMPTM